MPVAPMEFTPAQRAEVETLAAVLTAAQLADYFGIGRTTFFAIMDRDPDVAACYKKGKARAIGSIAQSLLTKARAGDTTSMIFYLKTQGGWRETATLEHVGTEAAPLPGTTGRDRLMAILDRYAAAAGSQEVIEAAAEPVVQRPPEGTAP